MAFSSYLRSRLSKIEHPEDEEEDMRPLPRSGSVRAFSHLPEQEAPPQPQEVLRRSSGIHPYNAMPEHEEDDEQPMPRSGSVRAFSHLLVKREARPLSLRGAQTSSRQLQRTGLEETGALDEDGVAAAKASGVFDAVRQQYNRGDSPHFMDEDGNLRPRKDTYPLNSPAPQASDDTSPWHQPPITHQDLHSQDSENDAGFGSHSSFAGRPDLHDLVHHFNGSAEEAKENTRGYFQNAAAAADTQDTTVQQGAAKAHAHQLAAPPTQSSPSAPPAAGMPFRPQPFPQAPFTGPVIKAVDDRQDSASKSHSDKADETPSGMEYALKFIGGSLVDTALNTAVAIFGGPGKYSYNPNPLRRAWHVDGWLPKIDREAYNRLQDGSELLVFSLAGATNPKNRIHLGIPAPTWRNENGGSPLDKEVADRWLKEYRSNILRTGSGEYQVGVEVEGKNNLLLSRLDRGTLEFAISRGTSDGTMSGSDMFRSMMKFYGPAVKAVEGNWLYGDNLAEMNALTQGGRMSLEQAAKMTWTGRQAAQHGFTEVEINHYTGESGRLANVKVTFRKKPGS